MAGKPPVVLGCSRLPERLPPTEKEVAALIEVRDKTVALTAWLEDLARALQAHGETLHAIGDELDASSRKI